MRDAAKIAAAIEILDLQIRQHTPVKDAVRDWGKANRYAGSGDRAWITGLVLDALRHQSSVSHAMQDDSARALAFGTVARVWGTSVEEIDAMMEGDPHAPEPLTNAERSGLERDISDAPLHIRGDFPEWLEPSFQRAFGDNAEAEAHELCSRAPVDLRVNEVQVGFDKAFKEVSSKLKTAEPSELAAMAIRIPQRDPRGKSAAAESIPAYGKGWVEVQDIGSQIAALASGGREGMQMLDYCAGAGGKTLALSALLNNTGQIHAWDIDWRRLRDIWPRLKRAGAHNVQVHDAEEDKCLADFRSKMDVVFCDAPCTGTGTWRRRPDAKWRLRERALETRMGEQDTVLERAQQYVKQGGRLVYVTCSVLPEENEDRITAFLAKHENFKPVPAIKAMRASGGLAKGAEEILAKCEAAHGALQLSPARTDTDGFYICVLERVG